MTDKTQEEKEIERKRDEALRRALSAPPKPHGGAEGEKPPNGNAKSRQK